MTRLLRRRHVRLGGLLVILCAVLAAAILRASGSSSSADAGSQPNATPGQVRLVSAWLDQLPIPSGWHRDVTDTACPFGRLCVTASESPRELISAFRSWLAAHGGSLGKTNCAEPPARMPDSGALSEEPICGLFGSYRGVSVSVLSGQRNAYPQPSSWVLADVRYAPVVRSTTAPLPPVKLLQAIPRQWRLPMRCTIRIPGGCTRYIGRVTLPGSACNQIALLVSTLERSNYDIQLQFRHPTPAGARCAIGADRKLEPGGGGWFTVGAVLEDTGKNTATGQVFISAM